MSVKLRQYLKKETEIIHTIIDLSLNLHHFQQFLKELLIININKILVMNNVVLDMHAQQTQ
jgi:hypothetical protein